MVTINISDELYTQITKTLNDTRNAKNSMTHELESQQLCTDTAISELKHPSAVVELMKASDNAQANIELLNKILRQVSVTSAFTPKKLSKEEINEILGDIYAADAALNALPVACDSNGQEFNLKKGESISCNTDDVGFGLFTCWSKDLRTSDD